MALALIVAGCHREPPPPTPTIATPTTEQAASAVNSYATNPSENGKAKADAALAQLDAEIVQLQSRIDQEHGSAKAGDQAKLDDLKTRRNELRNEYDQTKFDRLQADTKGLLDRMGQSMERGANAVGDAAKATGDKVKNAASD